MPLFAIAHVQRLRDGAIAIKCSDFPECEVHSPTMQAAREAFGVALSERVHKMVEAGEMPRLHTFEELDYAFSVRCSVEMPSQDRQPGTFDTVIAVRAKLPTAAAARLAAMRGDRPRVWRRPVARIPSRQPQAGRGTAIAETSAGQAAGPETLSRDVSATTSSDAAAGQASPVGVDPAPSAVTGEAAKASVPASATPKPLTRTPAAPVQTQKTPARPAHVSQPPERAESPAAAGSSQAQKTSAPPAPVSKPPERIQPPPAAGPSQTQKTSAPSIPSSKPSERVQPPPAAGPSQAQNTSAPSAAASKPSERTQPQPSAAPGQIRKTSAPRAPEPSPSTRSQSEPLAGSGPPTPTPTVPPHEKSVGQRAEPVTSGKAAPPLPPSPQPYTLRSALSEIESGLRQKRAATPEELEQRDRLAKANAERLASVRAARQSRQAPTETAGPGSTPAAHTDPVAKHPVAPPAPMGRDEASAESYSIESAIAEIEVGLRPRRDQQPTEKRALTSKPETAPTTTAPEERSRANGKPAAADSSAQQPATAIKLNPSAKLAGVADQLSSRSPAPAKTSRFGLLWKGRSVPPKPPEG